MAKSNENATGQSSQKTVRQVAERYDVSKYNANRLIQTETSFFQNKAELDSYKQMGIKKYQFLATLDGKTSEICQYHDKKIYNLKDARQGLNAPPMHPHCRSTITPYIGKEYEPDVRIARNKKGRNEYVDNMSYEQWANEIKIPHLIKKIPLQTYNMPLQSETTKINHAKKIDIDEKYWTNHMETNERKFVKEFTKNHEIQWIKKTQKDNNTGLILPTKDFKWQGLEWELKSAVVSPRYKTFARYIRNGVKQGKENFIIDTHKFSGSSVDKLVNGLKKYNDRNPKYRAKRIIVFRKGGSMKNLTKK